MKKYCLNCGHGNEYSGMTPDKCSKCGQIFASEIKNLVQKHENGKRIFRTQGDDGKIERGLPDSNLDSFMEGEPEPISQEEISQLFLSKANTSFNLKDLVEEGKKQGKRKKTSRARRKKIKNGGVI